MKNKEDLADAYLKLIGKRKLWFPMNGYSAFLQGSEYNTQKYFGKWYDNQAKFDLFIHMKEGFSQVWLPEDDFKPATSKGFKEYLTNPKIFQKRIDYLFDNMKEMDKIYDQYSYEKISQTRDDILFLLINKIRDIIWDANAAAIFSIHLDKQEFSGMLGEEKYPITDEKLDLLWAKAVEPAFESFDKAQLIHILTLAKEKKGLKEIVESSQYVLTDYYSAKTLLEVKEMIEERYGNYMTDYKVASKSSGSEIEKINTLVKNHEKWLKSLPKSERAIAGYLQTVMKVRDRRKNFFAKGMTIMYRIAEKVFNEAGVDREFIPFYTVRELLKGKDHLRSSIDVLTDRKKGFQWLVPYSGEPRGLNINIDSGIEKINNYFEKCHLAGQGLGVINGQSAYKGLVKGKVHIVMSVSSEHGFKEGEILVAGMTRPEYLPLMNKAAAIVTDEGGISCHAAIISRELKKPCIIGTKIATRVLKDGDLVEVDANRGTVKLLKK
jgi:phosphohistidine swiveling domain-containing protein